MEFKFLTNYNYSAKYTHINISVCYVCMHVYTEHMLQLGIHLPPKWQVAKSGF